MYDFRPVKKLLEAPTAIISSAKSYYKITIFTDVDGEIISRDIKIKNLNDPKNDKFLGYLGRFLEIYRGLNESDKMDALQEGGLKNIMGYSENSVDVYDTLFGYTSLIPSIEHSFYYICGCYVTSCPADGPTMPGVITKNGVDIIGDIQ